MRTLLAALIAAAFALAAVSVRAADPPEAVYQKVHAALLAGDFNAMVVHATAAQRAELQALPGKEQAMKLMAAGMPKTYTVSALRTAADGKTAVMHAAGMGGLIGPPAMMYGVVNFAMEGSDWKVAKSEWSNDKPPALPAGASKPASTPAKPAAANKPAAATAVAPAADDGKAALRLAAEEKRAREREEAARKRAELEKLCVIKPVMTDAEKDLCRRVAQQR